jgi:predicted dehydrogenase
MPDKIRLGLIGASVRGTWSARSHLPALRASTDVELTAVCTTRADSAEAARQAWGARLAFDDYRRMIASPEIDAVAVVVRVPSHYAPTKAALEAGKHVYCEWPLGRTTVEAVELTALAQTKGLVTAVGLQARVNPALMQMKEQVEAGFLGEVMAVHVSLMREGVLSRPSHRTWQRDAALGANTLTIANGHTVDAMRFVAGDFARLSAVVATQAKQWLDTGTKTWLDVTSPDNVLLSGRLANGAVVSVHIGAIPFAGRQHAGADAGTGALHRGRTRYAVRRSHQRRPNVRVVRPGYSRSGDPRRRKPPADLRDRGPPAPLGRRHQASLRQRPRGELRIAARVRSGAARPRRIDRQAA